MSCKMKKIGIRYFSSLLGTLLLKSVFNLTALYESKTELDTLQN